MNEESSMKHLTYLTALFLFCITGIYTTFAQCGTNISCPPNKKYNYKFCNSSANAILDKCSDNPLSEHLPWKILKTPLPVCLRFCESGPASVQVQIQTGGYSDVFKREYVQEDLNKAA